MAQKNVVLFPTAFHKTRNEKFSFFLMFIAISLSLAAATRTEAKAGRKEKFILGIFPHKIYVYLLNRLIFTWVSEVWCIHHEYLKIRRNKNAWKVQSDKHKIDFRSAKASCAHNSKILIEFSYTHEILMDRLSIL